MRELFGNGNSGTKGSGSVLDEFGVADGAFITDRKLPPALCPAAGKNRAAIHRFHSSAEPVRLCPFAIVRLKSTFWHVSESARAGNRSEAPREDTKVLVSKLQYRGQAGSGATCGRSSRLVGALQGRMTVAGVHSGGRAVKTRAQRTDSANSSMFMTSFLIPESQPRSSESVTILVSIR